MRFYLQNLARFHHLPTPQELVGMKEDLAFKETEMKKSEVTSSGLAGGMSMLLYNGLHHIFPWVFLQQNVNFAPNNSHIKRFINPSL